MNWSRRYEWLYAIRELRNSPHVRSVLNAACGESAIHAQFAHKLQTLLTDKIIYNTDMRESEVNKTFNNFFKSDITIPSDAEYDAIVCISTVEELGSKHAFEGVMQNFLEQAIHRIIITADCPSMPLEWLEEFTGMKVLQPSDKLTGANSSHQQREFEHLSVVLLDIELG